MTQDTNKFHYHVIMETIDSNGTVLSTLGPYTVHDRKKADTLAINYSDYISSWLDATNPDYDGDYFADETVYVTEDNQSDGMIVNEFILDAGNGKTERTRITACSGEMMSREEADELLAQKLSEELGFVVTPMLHPVTGQPGYTIDMPDALAEILSEVGIGEVISKPSKDIIFH